MKKQLNRGFALLTIATLLFAFSSCKKSEKSGPTPTKLNFEPTLTVNSLNQNLVAYWPLDGNANDLSGNSHNGTLNSVFAIADRFGNPNGAYRFNGTSSYISVPDAASLRLNGTDFTINAWVRLHGYNASYGSQLLNKHTSGLNDGWNWSVTGNLSTPIGAQFYGPGGGSTNATGTKVIDTGVWHMVTCVYLSSTSQIKFYVDGILDNTTNSIASPSSVITSALYFGKDSNGSNYYLNGDMDEVRIYSAALDVTMIQGLYNAPDPGGLIAYWTLDGNANDYSGNGHNGTINGATSDSDRFHRLNSAYKFNGTSSYITVPDAASLRLSGTDFTLNAWVKLHSYNASFGSAMLSKHTTGANDGWTWSITGSASSPLGVVFYGPGGGSTNAVGTHTVLTGSWYMVTSVYTASTQQLKIYVNGVLDNTTSNVASPNSAITSTLYIGRDSAGSNYYLDGWLDDIRIYNKALTLAQITTLYGAQY